MFKIKESFLMKIIVKEQIFCIKLPFHKTIFVKSKKKIR